MDDVTALISQHHVLPPSICGEWLPQPGLVMIAGDRGAGKTRLVHALGWHLTIGRDFIWPVPSKKRVVVFDGELPKGTPAHNFQQLHKATGTLPEPGHLTLECAADYGFEAPDLSTPEGQGHYTDIIEQAQADVVVVDNLSCCLNIGSDFKEESRRWASFKPWMKRQREAGRTLIMLHHTNKGGGIRGSHEKEDLLDTVATLKAMNRDGKSAFALHFTKTRYFHGASARSLYVRYWSDELGLRYEATPLAEATANELKQLQRELGSLRHAAAILGIEYALALKMTHRKEEGE